MVIIGQNMQQLYFIVKKYLYFMKFNSNFTHKFTEN